MEAWASCCAGGAEEGCGDGRGVAVDVALKGMAVGEAKGVAGALGEGVEDGLPVLEDEGVWVGVLLLLPVGEAGAPREGKGSEADVALPAARAPAPGRRAQAGGGRGKRGRS